MIFHDHLIPRVPFPIDGPGIGTKALSVNVFRDIHFNGKCGTMVHVTLNDL